MGYINSKSFETYEGPLNKSNNNLLHLMLFLTQIINLHERIFKNRNIFSDTVHLLGFYQDFVM